MVVAEAVIITAVSNIVTSVLSSIISSTINSSSPSRNFQPLSEIHKNVLPLQSNLQRIESWLHEGVAKNSLSSDDADLVCQIEGVAYEAQNVIDQLSWVQQHPIRFGDRSMPSIKKICKSLVPLHEIDAKIVEINKSMTGIITMADNLKNLNIGKGSSAVNQSKTQSTETIPTDEDDKVIGFDNQIQKIREMLIWKNHEQLSIISIVGMGGIGKSILARKIFNDRDVKDQFRMRIWIGISEPNNVRINSEGVKKMTDERVQAMLNKSIKDGKCLIVIDGIWNTDSWDAISNRNSIFSSVTNGSRIIKTTRKLDVAMFPQTINNIETEVYEVELLDDEKSQELLKNKAFPSNAIPSRTTREKLDATYTNQITQKCQGLPLALIGLRDFISSNLSSNEWSITPDEIDWDELPISKSLALGYNDLPLHLKPIFLYITSFPGGDQFIRVSELIKLWIAEGFIKHKDNCPSEKTARTLVDELHKRCLVKVVKRSKAHGWITRITIHDVVRDWGRAIAKKERFLKIIKDSGDVKVAKLFYRVALYKYHVDNLGNQISNLRTLLGFHLPEEKITSSGLNSTRVLTFNPSCSIKKSPECITNMVFLQYICLRKFSEITIPLSIELLFRLQTLDCRESTINRLSETLWNISTLRHLYLKDVCCNWSGPRNSSGRDLSTLYIYDRAKKSKDRFMKYKHTGLEGIADAVEGMVNLVALGLISYTGSLPQNILGKISKLKFLEELELREEVPIAKKKPRLLMIPPDYKFPEKLKKIKLGCFNLENDPMVFLEKLPELVVLELSNVSKVDSMYFSATGFPRLKYLTIINFLGKKLEADAGAMPNLCHVKLDGCVKLEEIPRELKDAKPELTNGTPTTILA